MFTDRQFAPPASVIVSADFPWPATPADLYRLADVSDIADELILLHDFTARRLFWIKTMYLRGHQLTASVRHQVTTGRAAYPPASGIPDDDLDQTA
jgi:hypothetical protein